MSVLPPSERPRKKRRWLTLLLVLLVIAATAGYLVWDQFFHRVPQRFASTEEQFKYGSIGTEQQQGIPYWIWLVLPRVFPEYLPGPGGYASLGFLWEDGREMPVGLSKMRIGYERVAANCAVCHTGSYREMHDGRPGKMVIVPTAPATRFDPQRYLAFLAQCANDPRFNADTLLEEIDYNVKLPWLDRQVYRYLLIPGTRKALRRQAAAGQWMTTRPPWGHGRIDPFNPVKFGMLEMDPSLDETVGNSDMMPLWELNSRVASDGYHLHWDGLSTDPLDCALAGALGDGATTRSLPVEDVRKLTDWLLTFRPTTHAASLAQPSPGGSSGGKAKIQTKRVDLLAYPYGYDSELAARGADVFAQHCQLCHADGGGHVNRVIPLRREAEGQLAIATDINRLRMWNPPPRDPPAPFRRYNRFYGGRFWSDPNTFVPTHGYVAVPLNGLWLRAPYLHNGSVPTLEDLLQRPMDPSELAELLAALEPGSFERLQRMLSVARPPSQPSDQLAAELDRLKPAIDKLIKAARLKQRRPPLFYRGSDVLDPARVGFVHTSRAAADRMLAIPYATFVQGNSNRGHLYGVGLGAADKLALVEYLKSL